MVSLGAFLDEGLLEIEETTAKYTPSTRSITSTGFLRLLGFCKPLSRPEEDVDLGFRVKVGPELLSKFALPLPLNEKKLLDQVMNAVSTLAGPWETHVPSGAEHMRQAKLILGDGMLMRYVFSEEVMKKHFDKIPEHLRQRLLSLRLAPMPQATPLSHAGRQRIIDDAVHKRRLLLKKEGVEEENDIEADAMVSCLQRIEPKTIQGKSGTPDHVFTITKAGLEDGPLLLLEVKNGDPKLLSRLYEKVGSSSRHQVWLSTPEVPLDVSTINTASSGSGKVDLSKCDLGAVDSRLHSFEHSISCQIVEIMLAYGTKNLVLTTTYQSVVCELDRRTTSLAYSRPVQHYRYKTTAVPNVSPASPPRFPTFRELPRRVTTRASRLFSHGSDDSDPLPFPQDRPISLRRFLATLIYNLASR